MPLTAFNSKQQLSCAILRMQLLAEKIRERILGLLPLDSDGPGRRHRDRTAAFAGRLLWSHSSSETKGVYSSRPRAVAYASLLGFEAVICCGPHMATVLHQLLGRSLLLHNRRIP